jgi:SAM-dependent methyltransferase
MHDTAYMSGRLFFQIYASKDHKKVLDVGSMNVNGTLRDHVPPHLEYVGVDLSPGMGVDVVLQDPNKLPFDDHEFDLIVSTSAFEHCQFFWIVFNEMVRVLKENGYLYINAPSNGVYHDYPYDNWRFYPDAGLALQAWARENAFDVLLVESGVLKRNRDIWNDFVLVFHKGDRTENLPPRTIVETMANSMNIRTHRREEVGSFSRPTEDMNLLGRYRKLVTALKDEISQKNEEIARLQAALRKSTKRQE